MSPVAKKSFTKAKPKIEINLDGGIHGVFAPLFTTWDEIRGQVCITCQADLGFEDIYITFEGATKTYVEKIATASPTTNKTDGFHSFLRMVQPMDPSAFPESRTLEAHKTYKFPFNFVVPERLLPQACDHEKSPGLPQGAHLTPPPSLGDPMVSAWGKTLMDDMCPDMATVLYSLRCRMTSGRSQSGKHTIMAEASKKLGICPVVEEAPPLKADGGDKDDYILRREKKIQRGSFRGKLGWLTAEAAQPKSLRLPSIRSEETCPVTTMATVNVRFDPVDEKSEPPKLNMLNAKLKVATFYASRPISDPIRRSSDFQYATHRGIFVDGVPLASRNLSNIQWERQTSKANPANDDHSSIDATSKIPAPSKAYKNAHFYRAKIMIPIELPRANKIFVPSFHSCLVSRIYALDICISMEQPKATIIDPSILLKLPIQLSSKPNPNAISRLSGDEVQALAVQMTEDFFPPRSVAPPSADFIGCSTISSNNQFPAMGTTSPDTSTPVIGAASPVDGDNAANLPGQHGAFAAELPPSLGPGYNHRSSWAPGVPPQRPTQDVRMLSAQQRFRSLAFDSEETEALARANDELEEQPPQYSSIGGGGYRVSEEQVSRLRHHTRAKSCHSYGNG